MQYDPIKLKLSDLIGGSFLLRWIFFRLLDLLFLRSWYVHRELKRLKLTSDNRPIDNRQSTNRQSTILDAGMGFGQYFDRMNRMFRNARVVGVEIDRKHLYGGVEYFRRVHPDSRIVVGDVQILPFQENKFDLILTVDVMEHIEDDNATFREFSRVLRPGGYLIMHTPRIVDDAPPFDSPPGDRGGGDSDTPPLSPPTSQGGREVGWHVDEHVRDGYRDSEARERLENAGLKVVKIVRGYGWAGRVAWNLLQRIPLSLLAKGKLMLLPVTLYLLIASPFALVFMWLDILKGDNPKGGSLLMVAQRTEST